MAKAPKKGRSLTLLSASEKERVRARIAEEESYLRGSGSDEVSLRPNEARGSVNTSAIEERIKRDKKLLERMDPENHKLTGKDRQAAFKEMKEHEEWLSKRMLSTWEMGAYPSATDPNKDHLYRQASEKSFKQEVGNPEFQERARRFKELARRVDPDDAELPNIERLRSRRRY